MNWLFEYHLQHNHYCACTDTHLSHSRSAYEQRAHTQTHYPTNTPVRGVNQYSNPYVSICVCMHVYVINYEIR